MSCPICHKSPCKCYTKCNRCFTIQHIEDSYCKDCGNKLNGKPTTVERHSQDEFGEGK